MHETAAPPPGGGLTFEKVWASLMELRESQKETDRIVRETARQMRETDKRVGEITNRFGDMVEHMVVPNLVAKFQELGFTFSRVASDVEIADRKHDIITEIDAFFLENGDKVMIVETKTKPDIGDIQDHLERMKKLRAYADLRRDTRKYLGAIAGVVVDESVKNYALKNGFTYLSLPGKPLPSPNPAPRGTAPANGSAGCCFRCQILPDKWLSFEPIPNLPLPQGNVI
jgi:hypothetical protein